MNAQDILPSLGVVLALAIGVTGLLSPRTLGRLTGLDPVGPLGTTEIRALLGGLPIGLAIACLVTQHPAAYLAAGLSFLGVVAAKVVGLVADRPPLSQVLQGGSVDLVAGLLLVSGYWLR